MEYCCTAGQYSLEYQIQGSVAQIVPKLHRVLYAASSDLHERIWTRLRIRTHSMSGRSMQPARGHWCAAAAVAVAVAVIAISIAPVTEAANVAALPRHERAEGQPLRSLDNSDSPRLLAERMRRAGRRLLNVTAGGNTNATVSTTDYTTTTSPYSPATSTTATVSTTNYTTTPSPYSPATSTTATVSAAPPAAATIVQSPKHVVTMTLKLEYSKDEFEKKEVKDKFMIAIAAAANTDKANVKILSIKVRARHCVPVVFLRWAVVGVEGRACCMRGEGAGCCDARCLHRSHPPLISVPLNPVLRKYRRRAVARRRVSKSRCKSQSRTKLGLKDWLAPST